MGEPPLAGIRVELPVVFEQSHQEVRRWVENDWVDGLRIDHPDGLADPAGYLRDLQWPHGGAIDLIQGEDMGMRSRLRAEIPPTPGASIRISGTVRILAEQGPRPDPSGV